MDSYIKIIPRSLVIATWNVNRIQARRFEIEELLTEKSPEILTIKVSELEAAAGIVALSVKNDNEQQTWDLWT